MKTFNRWRLQPADLEGLDGRKARDLIIECFFDAQKETIARAKKTLGLPAEEAEMKRSIVSIVRVVFKEIGGDFEAPTRDTLHKLVESLAAKAEMWGTPQDIIEDHRGQIGRILRLVP